MGQAGERRGRAQIIPCLLIVFWWCSVSGLAQQPAGNPLHTPPPASAYAGDAACASCHTTEARTYFQTPHYHDSSKPTRKTILGNFTPGKNVVRTANPNVIFAMIAAPDGLYQAAIDIANPQHLTGESHQFGIVIGSGRRAQTYLYWNGDELFELPISWWKSTNEWINSPGYVDGEVHFNRPVAARCLECHTNRFVWTPPPENRYVPESIVLGIGCEKCHGPGAEHVRRERSRHPPAAGSAEIAIVNPARLTRDRQLDVCALCHARGWPIAPSLSFQPGDRSTDYFRYDPEPPNAPVDVHGNQLAAMERSRCFLSGKLTCTTCHDVHRTQQQADAFSAKCLTCHHVQGCPESEKLGEAIRSRCIECHMPEGKSQAITARTDGQVLQAVMRVHTIAVYPEAAEAEAAKLRARASR